MSDALFELVDFEREALAASPWDGAPLEYTTGYYTPDEHEAAFERYRAVHGGHGIIPASHMWHEPGWITGPSVTWGAHALHVLTADTDCRDTGHDHAPLPSGGGYQANCPECRWHTIADSENAAVEAWHDHAMPGWRDLPVYPGVLGGFDGGKSERTALGWADDHYPEQWRRQGAPMLTRRTPYGNRHVPGRSPFGGYDICVEVVAA